MIKHVLALDIESYYDREEVSLRKLSPPEYIWHPKFKVHLLAAFDLTWDAPRIVEHEDIPAFLHGYDPAQTLCVTHNALFDSSVLSWRYGWVPARMCDTLGMVRALRSYKKNGLGHVAYEMFGADTKGDILPKVAGLDIQGIKAAGLWPDYCTYAMQDVRLCMQIYLRLRPEFPVEEARVMDLVLRAAVEPTLHADVDLLEAHLHDLKARKASLLRESGYDKAALMSTAQFKQALEDLGVEIYFKVSPKGKWIPQFSKTDPFLQDLLEYSGSPDDDVNYQVQTLAAARLSHKSTIEETRAERFVNIAKLQWDRRLSATVNGSGTLPVALRYGGAHTHRLSGEWKLNMQNLPRDKTKSKLREALVAPPGYTMITADLAQIEARIVAMICGETHLVEAFRRGEDIYASFASIVFRRVVTKATHPVERFMGKTAILGLGYGCGHERFYRMLVTGARQAGISLEGVDAAVAQEIVNIYRQLYDRITVAWRRLDGWLAHVINSPSQTQKHVWGPVTILSRRIRLPNGLYLRYVQPDEHLYGAKILENITQALARIVVMQAAVRLNEDHGLRFVLQAHDELVFLVPHALVEESKAIIEAEMVKEPEWLPGLPLAVELGEGANYGACK